MLKWYIRSDHEHVGLEFACTFSWFCSKDTKARVYGPGIQGFRFRILQSGIQIEGFRFRGTQGGRAGHPLTGHILEFQRAN